MSLRFFLLAWALPGISLAQSPPEAAVANPNTQVPPPVYVPMARTIVQPEALAPQDWKSSNTTVGRYPRGHADILRWEREQAATPAPPPSIQEQQP